MRGGLSDVAAADRPLIAERGWSRDLGAYVVDIAWLGGQVAFALGDGTIRIITGDVLSGGAVPAIEAHRGAILSLALHPDGGSLLTGGDDGRLVRTPPDGQCETVLDFGRFWVEHIETHSETGIIACGVGKDVHVLLKDEAKINHTLTHPSSAGGVRLDAKGRRLAVSHYGGVSVWWTLLPDAPKKELAWRGSHLALNWSPDGRFLVTAMQENALHGWRVGD
ncbi:MAG: WD40 repeat domain-containing protein, partial [Rhodospirillales bacterium]|nr:WD40 repeat domain-containing protein [Rhodospirillales bacterium]